MDNQLPLGTPWILCQFVFRIFVDAIDWQPFQQPLLCDLILANTLDFQTSKSNLWHLLLLLQGFSSCQLGSQKHRLCEVGRDLRGFLVQPHWSSSAKGHLEAVVLDHTQMAFEHLQGWRCCSLSGKPMPVLSCPHGEEVSPGIERKLPVFQFVPIASGQCAPLRRAWLHLLCTPLSAICAHWQGGPEPSLLQGEQSQRSQPFLTWKEEFSCSNSAATKEKDLV